MFSKKKLIQSRDNLNLLVCKLNKLCRFLNELYDINSGGCCFVATCLARLLDQDKVKYKIGIDYGDDSDVDSISELNHAVFHVVLIINGELVNPDETDSYETYEIKNWRELYDYYNRVHDWSSFYNKCQNSFISKTIANFYYDFTEDLRERK